MPANLIDADAAECAAAIRERPFVLVDFWAAWCAPCRALAPVVARLAETHPSLTVVKLDVAANGDAAEAFGVQGLPCLVLFKAQARVETFVGRTPYILLDRAIRKHE